MSSGIGMILKKSRNEAKMSVKQISDILTQKGFKASESTIYSWENGNSQPTPGALLVMCGEYGIKDILRTFGYDGYREDGSIQLNINEIDLGEKYRTLDNHGKEVVDLLLNKEAERMTELSSTKATVIDIQPHLENNTRLIKYHHSASAGTGVFILGNETVDQLQIPDTPENRKVDYAIHVSGKSMEPDYYDGDIVLVSQKVELNHGDVGIFIINNNAYIKEYGETELISRNPDVNNITISRKYKRGRKSVEFCNHKSLSKIMGRY